MVLIILKPTLQHAVYIQLQCYFNLTNIFIQKTGQLKSHNRITQAHRVLVLQILYTSSTYNKQQSIVLIISLPKYKNDVKSMKKKYNINNPFPQNQMGLVLKMDFDYNAEVLFYFTTSIYYIDYSLSSYEYESQVQEPANLFANIPIDNQKIEFLLFNSNNSIYKYSQFNVNIVSKLNSSQIVDFTYNIPYDTLIIALGDQILFYNQYQKSQNDFSSQNSIQQIGVFASNGGIIFKIDTQKQIILEEINLIRLVNEDPLILSVGFSYDIIFQRYFFFFSGQKWCYVWNLATNKQEQYLSLPNNQGNKIKLTQDFIAISFIQKNYQNDQITDNTIFHNNIIIIFFIQKYEVFIIKDNQSILISQQEYNYPRFLGYIFNQQNSFLKIYGLHQKGVFENNYSIRIYLDNTISKCSISIQGNDITEIKQYNSNIQPKQELINTEIDQQQNTQNKDNFIQSTIASAQVIIHYKKSSNFRFLNAFSQHNQQEVDNKVES
ncbi:hypothetical protein ABPG72_007861 [Tetrahymena utriculariae]